MKYSCISQTPKSRESSLLDPLWFSTWCRQQGSCVALRLPCAPVLNAGEEAEGGGLV